MMLLDDRRGVPYTNCTRCYGAAAANFLKNSKLSHGRYHKQMGTRIISLGLVYLHSLKILHGALKVVTIVNSFNDSTSLMGQSM
jgi:hypothetical protein